MNRNLCFLANDRLMRYHGTTGVVDVLTDCHGQLPPEHIATLAPAGDRLMIVTEDAEGNQGLWRYGAD